ncbi:MAG: sigma-54-dependent Fis family transcriptional regulator [Nitrospirae bacterium]|nr:sigma-54-dependent Fis family transcriptional regulator [Nitrospirota bacterium]
MDFPMKKILVVDDNNINRKAVAIPLIKANYKVKEAASVEEAFNSLNMEKFDLIISDLKMPSGKEGIDVLKKAKQVSPSTNVIIISAFGSIDEAVEAMKEGATDFLRKENLREELIIRVEKALEHQEISRENVILAEQNRTLLETMGKECRFSNMVGKSKQMLEIFGLIDKLAKDGISTVLISGDSGTGKELVAKAIHFNGPRASHPFIAINCSTLTTNLLESELFGHEKGAFTDAYKQKPGKLELADEGTLFLDEIGTMPMELQSKLLRVLQEKEFTRVGGTENIKVDVRIIAATNSNLEKEISEGKFREDLFYRLNVFPISLPPLRERREDIPLLAEHFLSKYNKEKNKNVKIVNKALKLFQQAEWKGNIRELENVIERLVLVSDKDMIEADDLIKYNIISTQPQIPSQDKDLPLKSVLKNISKEYEIGLIQKAIQRNNGNVSKAAKELGIARETLHRKIKALSLSK